MHSAAEHNWYKRQTAVPRKDQQIPITTSPWSALLSDMFITSINAALDVSGRICDLEMKFKWSEHMLPKLAVLASFIGLTNYTTVGSLAAAVRLLEPLIKSQ